MVFVTSGTTKATSDDSDEMEDYNTFVDGYGDVARESDWKVIGSTASLNARINTGTADGGGVPIYNLAGRRVAG
ncbi:MAG: hypothetical protein P8N76_20805 [Pirellulaceae bacterium]|nr:hypothetical protein [Pirellulaceae bacterium]